MTKAQQTGVSQVVAAIRRNGFDAVVQPQDDGTVKVQRVGATSFAIVGRRGGVRWC